MVGRRNSHPAQSSTHSGQRHPVGAMGWAAGGSWTYIRTIAVDGAIREAHISTSRDVGTASLWTTQQDKSSATPSRAMGWSAGRTHILRKAAHTQVSATPSGQWDGRTAELTYCAKQHTRRSAPPRWGNGMGARRRLDALHSHRYCTSKMQLGHQR